MKDLVEKHDIKKFLVAHSYTLNAEDMVLDARSKVEDQLYVR